MGLVKKLGKNVIQELEISGDLVSKVPDINPAYFFKRGFIGHITYYCSPKAEKIIRTLEKQGRFVEKVPNINLAFIANNGFKESIGYYYN